MLKRARLSREVTRLMELCSGFMPAEALREGRLAEREEMAGGWCRDGDGRLLLEAGFAITRAHSLKDSSTVLVAKKVSDPAGGKK